MNTKSIIALCFLFTLMFAGIGYIYYNVLEYEIISKDDGFTSEAQKNRFLLSQIFLETGGHNISTEKNISDLPIGFNSNTDVVISTIANPVTVRKDIHKLEIWIKKGGTYIISMSDTQLEAGAMNEDHFANYFDVELTHIKQPKNLSSSNRRFDCVASHSNTQSNDDMFIPEMVEKIKDRLNIQEEDRFSTIHSDYTSFKTLYPKDNDLSIYPDYEEYDELIYY